MSHVQVKIGDWLRDGWNLYADNFLLVFISTLVTLIISAVSFSLLTGPMIVGVYKFIFRLIDKQDPKPTILDVFTGFEHFLQSFLFCLVWLVVLIVGHVVLSSFPFVGWLLSTAFGFIIGTVIILFGYPILAERKIDFWSASLESAELAK